MKRSRPKQHTRRLKSGRVIKVNKGVRKAKRRMATFDNAKERSKISDNRWEMGSELKHLIDDHAKQYSDGKKPSAKKNLALMEKTGEVKGYHQALEDLGLWKEGESLKEVQTKAKRKSFGTEIMGIIDFDKAEEEKQAEKERFYDRLEQGDYEEDAGAFMDDIFERDKKAKFGLSSLDDSSNILDSNDDLALVQHYDNESPASESPTVFEIKSPGGKTVWSSGVTQMGEFAFDGATPNNVSFSDRKEAEKKFKELTK